MITINIEDHSVVDTVNLNETIGTAVKVCMRFNYNSAVTTTVKGFFKLMDASDNTLRHGDRVVSTAGWTTDDSAIYNNFLNQLGLTAKP